MSHKINNIKKATLIDINSNFLENIDHKDFNIEELELLNEDILGVLLHKESDLIFSIFAYHHVCDDRKLEYIQQIKNALRQGGYLILTEIFSPNKEMTLSYYEKLLDNIAVKDKSVGLQQFLQQTAKSTDFEFKVSKKFSDEQFEQMGFEKIEEIKIWPHDDELGKDIGTFIQVYQL